MKPMMIFAGQRQCNNFRIALQTLRDCGVAVSGPYRRQNGVFVFSVADCVVTEDELLHLEHEGQFAASNVQGVLSESKKLPY